MHVILIDDDEVDRENVARLVRRSFPPHRLTVFPHGQAAQHALLSPWGPRLTAEPYIFLLDLAMPVMDGWQFLAWYAGEPRLRPALIFVFTANVTTAAIATAYTWPIAGYLIKSHLGEGYARLGALLDAYDAINTFASPKPT